MEQTTFNIIFDDDDDAMDNKKRKILFKLDDYEICSLIYTGTCRRRLCMIR